MNKHKSIERSLLRGFHLPGEHHNVIPYHHPLLHHHHHRHHHIAMAPNRKTTISIPVSSALPSPTYSPPSPSPSSLSPPRSTAKLQLEPLLPVQMCKVLDAILASVNAPTVEAAILYMMHRYSFDFEVLKKCLEGTCASTLRQRFLPPVLNPSSARSLDVSFSRIQFQHIAPLVGLAPEFELRDVGLFEVNRARITDELFAKIHDDMCVAVNNYGPPMDHENEEARSRFIAPVSVQTRLPFLPLHYFPPTPC